MSLLRSLRWFLITFGLAVVIVLVGGTLIRYGTVTRHHHMIVTNAAQAYGGLAVVIIGFAALIKAGSNRRRKRRLASGAPVQFSDVDAQRRAAMGFDMQQKQQEAFQAQQRAAQQRSWEGR